MKKRIFLIVLDSLGIGALPDAELFGDVGTNTLRSISKSPKFNIPNLISLGLGNIDGVDYLPSVKNPKTKIARLREKSMGKDTTVGHFELSGVIMDKPLPTYPKGFPKEVINEFIEKTGVPGILCNKPYSGTDVIRDYGDEHIRTGKPIIYTSADSVFQIAAHQDIIEVDDLYRLCIIAREILQGKHGVGRVIARPFTGYNGQYTRTAWRRDYSLEAPGITMLDILYGRGITVTGIGKISDIFAWRGISQSISTHNNADGMAALEEALDMKNEQNLIFANLVDFDMVYGHRNNIDGYASALSEFDRWLGTFIPKLRDDDLLIITADHGCDPGDISTDHTREYVPMIAYQNNGKYENLGTVNGLDFVSSTVLSEFGIMDYLINSALDSAKNAYSPYSGFSVGAALLCGDGTVYTGANIENASYSMTICAERVAFSKAIFDGKRSFKGIAVVSVDKKGRINKACTPCGACLQFMSEFCTPSFEIYGEVNNKQITYHLFDMLPNCFSLQEDKSK